MIITKNSSFRGSRRLAVKALVFGVLAFLFVSVQSSFARSSDDYSNIVFSDDMSGVPDNWENLRGATHTFSGGWMHVMDSDPTLSGRVRATLIGTQTPEWYVQTTLNIASYDSNGSNFQGLWHGVDIDTLSWFFAVAFDANFRLLAWDSNAEDWIYTGYDIPSNTLFKIEAYGNMSDGTYTIEIDDIAYGTYHSDPNISSLYRLILGGFSPQPESTWTIDVGPVLIKDNAEATFESTIEDIEEALASGGIDNQGIASSLLQKLNVAEAKTKQNALTAARNILQALKNSIEAQRGKHMSDASATLLLQELDALLHSLP